MLLGVRHGGGAVAAQRLADVPAGGREVGGGAQHLGDGLLAQHDAVLRGDRRAVRAAGDRPHAGVGRHQRRGAGLLVDDAAGRREAHPHRFGGVRGPVRGERVHGHDLDAGQLAGLGELQPRDVRQQLRPLLGPLQERVDQLRRGVHVDAVLEGHHEFVELAPALAQLRQVRQLRTAVGVGGALDPLHVLRPVALDREVVQQRQLRALGAQRLDDPGAGHRRQRGRGDLLTELDAPRCRVEHPARGPGLDLAVRRRPHPQPLLYAVERQALHVHVGREVQRPLHGVRDHSVDHARRGGHLGLVHGTVHPLGRHQKFPSPPQTFSACAVTDAARSVVR